MNITPLALIFLGTATLIAVLSIPLILRKIPMNHFYGVRFPQSYKSIANWYEINHIGGLTLLIATIPIYIAGVTGLVFADAFGSGTSAYPIIGAIVTCLSLCTATFIAHSKAKRIDAEQKG